MIGIIGFIVASILVPIIIGEFLEWCPWLAEKLVYRAARGLSSADRERYTQEWLAEIDFLKGKGKLTPLLLACRIYLRANQVRSALEDEGEALENKPARSKKERLLIIGTGLSAIDLCRWISVNHSDRFEVVGFADYSERSIGDPLAAGKHIRTSFRDLVRFSRGRVDRVLVALEEKRGVLPISELLQLRILGVRVEGSVEFSERVTGWISVDEVLPSSLIYSENCQAFRGNTAIKRVVDLVVSSINLVAVTPAMIMAAALVFAGTRGPVLVRSERIGRDGKLFSMLTFRTVFHERGEVERRWPTRLGRVLRASGLNQLPMLLNVVRGDMSFVGPNPETPSRNARNEDETPLYNLRQAVRPGLSGWAQVNGAPGSGSDAAQLRLGYDLYYIKNSNILFDLYIVLASVKQALFRT